MEAFTYIIGLWMPGFSSGVIYVLRGKVKLVFMLSRLYPNILHAWETLSGYSAGFNKPILILIIFTSVFMSDSFGVNNVLHTSYLIPNCQNES